VRQFKSEVQRLGVFPEGTHRDILVFTTKTGYPMSYTHLTPLERNQLYKMRVIDQLSISFIAQEMNRSRTTISRELKRNSSNNLLYLPDTAQQIAKERRQESKDVFGSISINTTDRIKYYLELSYSPRQLSGRMKTYDSISISHETIYQLIYADHHGLGEYKKHLRQKQKKRRRRKGVNQKRGKIPNRVGNRNRSLGGRYSNWKQS
jgi:transposase, IS30 family